MEITTHYRDMPTEVTDSELISIWTVRTDAQLAADRAAIAQYFEDCRLVAAGVARAKAIEETNTVSERISARSSISSAVSEYARAA